MALEIPPRQHDDEAEIAPYHLVPAVTKMCKVGLHVREPVSRGGDGQAGLRTLRPLQPHLDMAQQVYDVWFTHCVR